MSKKASNKSYTVGSWKELRARTKTAPYRGMTYLIVAKRKKKPIGDEKMNVASYLKSITVGRK